MGTNISRSPLETAALGEAWGRVAPCGLVIALRGELGSGKTQLVKGLARGLGVEALVHSPTFALVNTHSGGRLPLFHLDLFRLDTPQQILSAGLEEYLWPDGVTVIEWADRWFGRTPGNLVPANPKLPGLGGGESPSRRLLFRWVELEVLTETSREISYEDIGA